MGEIVANDALVALSLERKLLKLGFSKMLDRFDVAISDECQRDGRLTNAELAARVGLLAAPCWRRVRALEESGYILSCRAEIDRHRIGLGVLAFVRLAAERNAANITRLLEDAICALPEVVLCHYISGTRTFELQVVRPDLEAFSRLAREVLLNRPHVKDLQASFSLGEVKSGCALPLDHLGWREKPLGPFRGPPRTKMACQGLS